MSWPRKPIYLLCILCALLQSACSHIPGFRPDIAAELKLLAGGGDARAQLMLAQLLDEGAGVPRDLNAAVGWYRQSAGQGNPDACFELARLHLSGKITAPDDNNAVRLLFKAGEAGNTGAQALLGSLYLAGRGKEEFFTRVKLAKRGAEQGEASAQYLLGWMLREGAGVPHSAAEAQLWLTKAAKQGNAAAALLLGDMAFNGEAARKDPSAAIRWFSQAAAAGDRAAAGRLSRLPDKGLNGNMTLPVFPPRQRSGSEDGYRRLQLEFAEEKATVDQEAALLAARRLLGLDPLDRDARTVAEKLHSTGEAPLVPLFKKAEQHLAAGEFPAFKQNLSGIISLDPDEMRLRELNGRYWQRLEESFRQTQKEAFEILRTLESFDTPESVRKNQPGIQKLTAAFTAAVEKMGREKPGDPRLPALVQKFDRVTAALARKREERREEHKVKGKVEPVDAGDAALKKGLSLLESGQFTAAAKIFEKLTRTPGYSNVAGAYIYLGITSLARIDLAKVTEAKKLRLKGMTSFQNALRFDRKANLPDGYRQYSEIFEDAKLSLK